MVRHTMMGGCAKWSTINGFLINMVRNGLDRDTFVVHVRDDHVSVTLEQNTDRVLVGVYDQRNPVRIKVHHEVTLGELEARLARFVHRPDLSSGMLATPLSINNAERLATVGP